MKYKQQMLQATKQAKLENKKPQFVTAFVTEIHRGVLFFSLGTKFTLVTDHRVPVTGNQDQLNT